MSADDLDMVASTLEDLSCRALSCETAFEHIKASYIQIAHTDLQRLDLFKPAQFLRIPHNQLLLLRLRTQATSYIPTHLHVSNTHMYTL